MLQLASMDAKLVTYIRSALVSGKSKDAIYRELLIAGWSVDDISVGYDNATSGASNALGSISTPVPESLSKVSEGVAQTTKQNDAAPHQKTARIILVIGAIFIGLGIFSFISGNWQKIGPWSKVSIIVVSMLISYVAAFLMNAKGYGKTGNAFLLLGSLIYGAGIFLIAQIFHLPVEWPDGFLLWFIGVLALGYAVNWRPLLGFGVVLGFVGGFGYPWHFFEFMWRISGNRSPITTATVSLFLLAVSVAICLFVAQYVRKQLPEEVRQRM